MKRLRLGPQDQALAWHMADFALALLGLLGHFWLRRQYARARSRDAVARVSRHWR